MRCNPWKNLCKLKYTYKPCGDLSMGLFGWGFSTDFFSETNSDWFACVMMSRFCMFPPFPEFGVKLKRGGSFKVVGLAEFLSI